MGRSVIPRGAVGRNEVVLLPNGGAVMLPQADMPRRRHAHSRDAATRAIASDAAQRKKFDEARQGRHFSFEISLHPHRRQGFLMRFGLIEF
jgi:hypothetical protein